MGHLLPICEFLVQVVINLLPDFANAHLGRQWMMAQVLGSLPSMWEIQAKLLASSFGSGHCTHWESELVDRGSLFLASSVVILPFKYIIWFTPPIAEMARAGSWLGQA